ncbi:MotA/TolQ/ExbB proton channel family protein [Ruegeria marina]|uniref:Biopolymer transport protein ExbB n=1 Tax=Ruegeria marina TaxID=639004 RepID=A0A1G7CY93_9RHOB|nr:MotA/TolQ/ExbB proton channel family protein [Ruegeria marina]SDE43455.1 biopolymer transport protein ExbB [Ruegeria marina]
MGDLDMSGLGVAGPVLALLGILSVASVTVLVARLLALYGAVKGQAQRDEQLRRLAEGETTSTAGTGAADRVLSLACDLVAEGVPHDVLAAQVEHRGNAEAQQFYRGVRFLELAGMIAPLLGLLGTVLGMIQSFRSLELAEGAANASILAGGIWQALLTTAAGLVVAIPALVGAALLSARADAAAAEVERTMVGAMAAVRRRTGG